MNRSTRIAIIAMLVVMVALVLVLKTRREKASSSVANVDRVAKVSSAGESPESPQAVVGSDPEETQPLPRLVELGSVTCIPCKAMAPILDELRKEYAGALQVDFVDVNKNRDAAMRFGLRIIPTQVFLDANGEELFRHEGFFPKEQILAKWKELGMDLQPARQ